MGVRVSVALLVVAMFIIMLRVHSVDVVDYINMNSFFIAVVYDGCPRAFHSDIWWSRTKFGSTAVHDCPARAIGLATRDCKNVEGWQTPDLFNCTSTSFISIMNIVTQLDSGELILSPLLSTKLAADLFKALNVSTHLYGNDLWLSLKLLISLTRHETQQKGLNLSHRQDKNFIKVWTV